MAVPVLQTTSISGLFSSTTAWTVAAPTGVAVGDLLLAMFDHTSGTGFSLAGWTAGPANTGGSVRISTLYRIADGTEGSSYAFVANTNSTGDAIVLRISGTSAAPLDGSVSGTTATAGTPLTLASFDTTKTDDLLIGFGNFGTSGANRATTISPSTGWTKVVDQSVTSKPQFEVYTKSQAAPGAVGNEDWSWSTTGSAVYLEMAIASPSLLRSLPLPGHNTRKAMVRR